MRGRKTIQTLHVAAVAASVALLGLVGCETLFHGEEDENEVVMSFDDAAVGTVPAGWRIAETAGKGKTAKWAVVKDESAPSKPNVLAVTETKNSGHTFNLAIAENATYKDLEVELKVKAVSGKQDQGGGPMWRVQDENNYYVARWNPLEDNFRVYYVKNGKRRQIASAKVKADPKKWHEIEVEHVGNTIVAEFDDKKLIEVKDSTFSEAGKIGLWTKADAATKFDKVEVKTEEEGDEDEDEDKDDD